MQTTIMDSVGNGDTSFWDFLPTIESVEEGVSSAYQTTKSVVKTVGSDVGEGIGYVTSGVGSAVGSVLDFGINKIILLLVVIGGILYFVSSTGAFKISALV